MVALHTYITAATPDGRIARGDVVSRAVGTDGRVLYYEVLNPVSKIITQVYPTGWSITPR
ncbi:hypothetical protein ACFPA8_07765 [Streptomyces ovatisporus]|uniref:Uncharacterized protein n=1 Tax=Streptomyces ovatisporus TaxID=1128682 RepID=A0ABV9A3I3_9ACTN